VFPLTPAKINTIGEEIKMQQNKVERIFTGIENLEEVLMSIISYHIEKVVTNIYYNDKANTIPSETDIEGVEQ
jgi:hypothetical protein